MRLVVASLLTLTACGEAAPCAVLPCPNPEAVTLTAVSAIGAASLPGLSLTFTSAGQSAGWCAGRTCHVQGEPGTYELTLAADGYVPVSRSIVVGGVKGGCKSCDAPETQQLTITLQPKAQHE